MRVTTLGIDLAKNIFQLHGVDEHGKVTVHKRVPQRVPVQIANRRHTKVCAEVSLRQPGLTPRPVACVSEESK